MKKIRSFLYYAFCVTLIGITTLLASCAYLTPTVVPPLTEELGYEIPNFYGITTTGLIKGSYSLEAEKMKLWGFTVNATLEATETARNGLIELAAVIGLGGSAALPMALNRVPRGAVRKEDHEKEVEEALKKEPPTL